MSGARDPVPPAVPSWLSDVPLAHRGLHGADIVENSRSAFVAAVEAGYGVELDVQLSADGVPVVFHDSSLKRLADRDEQVSRFSAAELAAFRLLESDEGIPSLAEALGVLVDTPVMVELKTSRLWPGPLEPAVAALLDTHPGPVCVASFNPTSLRWYRRNQPQTLRVMTAMMPTGNGPRAVVLRRMAELRDARAILPSALSYHLDSLPHPAVDRWRAQGGVVLAWTVVDQAGLERARDLADNVIFEHVRP